MATSRSAMRSRARAARRGVVVGTAALSVAVLGGCGGNGFGDQTQQIYQPGPGISVRHDGVYLLNSALVSNGNGNSTLVGALLNMTDGQDRLMSVTVTGSGKQAPQTTIVPGTVVLPPHKSVQLADTGAVRVDGDLAPGVFVQVRLTFHKGAPISIQLPVLNRSADFSKVPVGPVPTKTVSPTVPASG